MQSWEYCSLSLEWNNEQKTSGVSEVNGIAFKDWKRWPHYSVYLNQLGDQGWEVVASFSHISINEIILKRPKTK